MAKIDFDRFICTLMDDCKLNAGYVNVKSIERALKEQNLECCNGKIIEHETVRLKVGNWFLCADQVIYKNRPMRIVSFNEETGYLLETQDGSKLELPEWMAKKYLKPWTIKDARDGDVLVYHNTATEIIMLFKSWVVRRISAYTHFHIFNNDYRVNDSCDCGNGVHPATKEQRDLLFQEMKEAGYEWDSENKKMKKLTFHERCEKIAEPENFNKKHGCVSCGMVTPEENPENHDDQIRRCLINGMKFYYENNDEATWGTEKFSMKVKDILKWLEKQGENVSDTISPRFKLGDWIVGKDGKTGQITYVYTNGYDIDGLGYLSGKDAEEYRLWTIGDAKNGDVVVALPPKGSEHGEQIFMFKDIGDKDYAKDVVEYHCRVLGDDFYVSGNSFMGQKGDLFRPATKEEIDFMHMKMFESGYFWSEKKKQLVDIRDIENKI